MTVPETLTGAATLRLGFVPGVVPFKWVSRFRGQFGEPALVTSRLGQDDDAAGLLVNAALDAALMPLPVDKDVFHAIPLYVESDDQKGRVPGRQIGLVWLRSVDHPLIEPLTGIVRGRTANSSRGDGGGGEAKPVAVKGGAGKTGQNGKSGPKSQKGKRITARRRRA